MLHLLASVQDSCGRVCESFVTVEIYGSKISRSYSALLGHKSKEERLIRMSLAGVSKVIGSDLRFLRFRDQRSQDQLWTLPGKRSGIIGCSEYKHEIASCPGITSLVAPSVISPEKQFHCEDCTSASYHPPAVSAVTAAYFMQQQYILHQGTFWKKC